jgi:hypothetical protein
MIQSFYTVDFVTDNVSMRLVSPGDVIEADITPSVSQGATRYSSIGADWSERRANGAADSEVSFGVIVRHASHAASRSYCLRNAASLPSGETGVLTIAVEGGETWKMQDAVMIAVAPLPRVPSSSFQTISNYSFVGTQLAPVTALTLYAGIPWIWILQDWDDLTGEWDEL